MSDESERASVSVLASRKKETLDYRYPFGRVGSGLDLRNGDYLVLGTSSRGRGYGQRWRVAVYTGTILHKWYRI